jgi:hypothetical protein
MAKEQANPDVAKTLFQEYMKRVEAHYGQKLESLEYSCAGTHKLTLTFRKFKKKSSKPKASSELNQIEKLLKLLERIG